MVHKQNYLMQPNHLSVVNLNCLPASDDQVSLSADNLANSLNLDQA